MNIGSLLLLTVSTVLVLRSGDRIEVEGPVREQNGQIVFRVAGGSLYSIPAAEVDEQATRKAAEEKPATDLPPRRLRVSAAERDRLLKELENSHSGQAPPPQQWLEEPLAPVAVKASTPDPREEWSWRREARSYEETIRQSRENLQLLYDKIEQLQSEITGFLSLGYKPRQFTYQTTQLALAREQVPAAQLEVRRAERAFEQFRDDARRQGVLPGWLR